MNRLTTNHRLGLRSLELGQTFVRQADLKSRARPILEWMLKVCNETSLLAVLKKDSIIYLDAAETSQE